MEGGEETPGFSVKGIEREEVFERRGRTDVLAGVHLRNCVLEQRRLFVVAEAGLLLDLGRSFFIGLQGRLFVGSHCVTL